MSWTISPAQSQSLNWRRSLTRARPNMIPFEYCGITSDQSADYKKVTTLISAGFGMDGAVPGTGAAKAA